jgi:crotonobetainyl-CoA:carnitine CoA-transferase CaiB-like acyl-CoA transferase
MQGLLEGMRVVDLSVWRPGPYATQLLAEMGAAVTKVEPPAGDPMLAFPDLYDSLNAHKETLRLDLKDPTGRATLLDMADDADVVVEGFRPGVVDRLGVGYADVRARNVDVIYCSVSGFGQTGPLANAPGHDLTYMAWAAVLSPDGAPPVAPRIPVADLAAGMAAAMAISAACVRRTRTGEGAYLDVSMADVVATWTGAAGPRLEGAAAPTRAIPGYGTFDTADGRLALGVLDEDHFWSALCHEVGLDEHAGMGFAARAARTDELQAAIAAALVERSTGEMVEVLLAVGVPVAPVNDRTAMLTVEHFRQRGTVTTDASGRPAMGPPVRVQD